MKPSSSMYGTFVPHPPILHHYEESSSVSLMALRVC